MNRWVTFARHFVVWLFVGGVGVAAVYGHLSIEEHQRRLVEAERRLEQAQQQRAQLASALGNLDSEVGSLSREIDQVADFADDIAEFAEDLESGQFQLRFATTSDINQLQSSLSSLSWDVDSIQRCLNDLRIRETFFGGYEISC